MIRFNGETFPSMKAFKRAFPLYASYAEDVRDGADTVTKVEAVIAERRRTVLLAQRSGQRQMREAYKRGINGNR